jgi:hypothetical protein
MLVSMLYETSPLSPPFYVLGCFSWEGIGVTNDFYLFSGLIVIFLAFSSRLGL